MRPRICVVLSFWMAGVAGCTGGATEVQEPPTSASASAPPSESAAVSASASASASVSLSASASASATPPAPVARAGKVWPFHAFDGAVLVRFNHMPSQRGVQLTAYDDRGWSPNVVEKKNITKAQAEKAAALVMATEGGVDVSKCPFPRHAVVLLEGEVPVASINVCFECGDIRIWPAWAEEPSWDELSEKQRAAREARAERQMKLYEETFPKWEAFFRDEAGVPLAWE